MQQLTGEDIRAAGGFNPCFNGFMDKCEETSAFLYYLSEFQPLF